MSATNCPLMICTHNATAAKSTTVEASEKSSTPAEKSSSILDLPRGDMVQHGDDERATTSRTPDLASSTQGSLDNGGDDLDIPAFLRRQAN